MLEKTLPIEVLCSRDILPPVGTKQRWPAKQARQFAALGLVKLMATPKKAKDKE